MPNINQYLLEKSRRLCHHQTDAENLLWRHIRGRRLQAFRFKRQKVIGPYIVDFYCAKARLIVELDGGQHAENSAINYDQERMWLLLVSIKMVPLSMVS